MALQTGLHSLAIAHHLLALGLVGEVVVVNVLVLVAAHAELALVRRAAYVQELIGSLAFVAFAAGRIGVFATKGKLRAFCVVKAIGLPRRLGVAVLTSWRPSKLLEALLVWVVACVAIRARPVRCLRAKLLGVAFVASDFAVGAAQIKLGARLVIELVLLERAIFGRVAPIATLAIKEHVFVWGSVTARVAAVARLCAFKVEPRFRVALGACDVDVRTFLRKLRVALFVVVKVEARLWGLP